MSIRGTVWLQLGDPIEGFRFGPPLHLEWAVKDTDIFQELELLIEEAYQILVHQPITRWERLAAMVQPPEIDGRRVKLDLRLYGSGDTDSFVIIRARLPFPAWPLGGWVVVEGRNLTSHGEWTPLPTVELEKGW